MIRMEEDVYQGQQKTYRYPSSCGALQKERDEAVELCCPLLGNGQKDAVVVSGVDANWQTASPAAFQAEFIKTNQACHFYIRTRQYNGFDYFTSRRQIQRASLRFSREGVAGVLCKGHCDLNSFLS